MAYLRDGGRNDDDFLNELIGTLYLQECNYVGAANWLSKVSLGYHLHNYGIRKNAKLNFAINIHRLEQQMRTGKNENVRTIAKAKYALARYASFSSCWALTAYQDGEVYGRSHWIYPDICINGIRSERVEEEESRMQKAIDDAIKTINDDETAAEVQYLIGNLKTIAKKYPHTATAKFVSSHCDNWEDWI